ncbi:MAG: enoyl-CoA hydratase-related protein [Thermoanaerobaculia bacterium]
MNAKLDLQHDGRVARVTLAAPKANILDQPMVEALNGIFSELNERRDLCAIVIDAEGPHFSFGASIEEHVPERIGGALSRLSNLLRLMSRAPAPTIAAVRGQCLGGGLELVLGCDLVIAEETAQLGQPEIKLAVFPPVASALLPVRIGTAGAAALTLTGRSWSGTEAMQRGLVTRTAPAGQLDAALLAWLEEDFAPRSPAALRFAAIAIRGAVVHALNEHLPRLDRLYLDELMKEHDAVEGIEAFLAKREPVWKVPEENS